MNLETLELFYNQTEICKALHQENFDQLQQLIREKDLQLHDLYGEKPLLYQRLFLSSLNKSLYYYYLNVFGLSFSQVCYQNFSQAHPQHSHSDLVCVACKICHAYHRAYISSVCINPHVRQACQYIQEHLSESLTLETVSRNIFVSRCYLCQLFQEHLQQSFSEYLTESRINYAKRLLVYSKQPLEEISLQCGYNTASYFSTVFKKNTGYSPNQFRKEFTTSGKSIDAI